MPISAASRPVRALAGGLLLLTLLGCPTAPPTGTVVSVTIPGGNLELVVGETQTLPVVVVTEGPVDDSVTWSSDQPEVASIDADGLLTALDEGATTITATSDADPSKSDTITVVVLEQAMLHWTRQFGTPGNETGRSAAVDSTGNVIVVGQTDGNLAGSNSGLNDIFVRKYDSDGNHVWTRQFGSDNLDTPARVTTDTEGNVLIVGHTVGIIEPPGVGQFDAWVRKYDASGDHVWTRQFGTGLMDMAVGVTSDNAGNAIIVGVTAGTLDGLNAGEIDAFVRKLSPAGDHIWTRQFGTTAGDSAFGVSADAAGNLIVAGGTAGTLEGVNAGSADLFLRKYTAEGDLVWTRQFGTSGFESGSDHAADAGGNVVVVGETTGGFAGDNAGLIDVFVVLYDGDGNHVWTRQFGTSAEDRGFGVAFHAGNVIVTGGTDGDLSSGSAGEFDAFVRKYDASGNHVWTRQFGTSGYDTGEGIGADGQGNLYVGGWTTGGLVGDNAGEADAFVRKYGR